MVLGAKYVNLAITLAVSLLSESFFAKNTPGVFVCVCVFRAVSIQLPSLPSSCVKGRGSGGLNWVKPRVQWAAGLCLYLPTLAPVRTVPGSGPLGYSRNFLDTNNSEFPCCMRQRTLVSGLNLLLLCPAPTTSNIGFLHLSPVNLSKQTTTNNKTKQNTKDHHNKNKPQIKFSFLGHRGTFQVFIDHRASRRQSGGLEYSMELQTQLGPCAASGICPTCLMKPLSSHTAIPFLLRPSHSAQILPQAKLLFVMRTQHGNPVSMFLLWALAQWHRT